MTTNPSAPTKRNGRRKAVAASGTAAAILVGLVAASVSTGANAATPSEYRIDVGSTTNTTFGGTTYTADKYAKGGTTLKTAKPTTGDSTYAKLYDTIRWGMSGYEIPVENGTYDVKLRFVEDNWTKAGQRVFDIKAENKVVQSNFDIFKAAGGQFKAIDKTYRVTVTDGKLNIDFTNKVDNASLAGIAVFNGTVAGPTTPPTTTPTTSSAASNVKATVSGTTATLTWSAPTKAGFTGFDVARDGTDSSGYGAWGTTLPANATQQPFTALKTGNSYKLTVTPLYGTTKGTPTTVTVNIGSTTQPPVTTPPPTTNPPVTTPPVTQPPVTNPPVTNGQFHPTTIGAAVTDAANGNFNRWGDKMHGLYSTWAENGKIWAIDTPSSEYGANSVARLGDYDLDIATQNLLSSNWAAAANGADNAKFRQMFTDIKTKWGDRKGHVYVRPYHEFNGDWYQWSVRNTTDQANFVKTWQTQMFPIWQQVMGDDPRFKLEWSPNRDSKYGLDVRKAFPGSKYVDVIGVDYYDFAPARTDAEWAQEEFRTQNGGGPVGLGAWRQFAQDQGVPVTLPEWGVQFGDNPNFIRKVTGYFSQYRYTGTGNPAGKILGASWHNLQGKSPDPSAGGDFFVTKNAQDYSGRPQTAAALRTWINSSSWLYQPPCSGSACIRN